MGEAGEATEAYRSRREARHESVLLRGLEIHLRRWGPTPTPERPPLYCLHGWMDTGDTFQYLADEMRGDRPLVALDWRGFGRSAWAQEGYAFSDYVADLDALLQLYSPDEPAMLLGHSMGGNVACIYAGVRPGRVRCVVTLEGFGMAATQPAQAPERLRQWLDELRTTPAFNDYASFAQLATVIRRRHPRIDPARALHLAGLWAYEDESGCVRLRGDARHKRVFPMPYRRDESEAIWRGIRAPLFALAGAESSYLAQLGAAASVQDFLRCVPGSTLRTIEGAGHLLHLEQPALVAALIEEFLDSH
jgi:pimeloyl-ACP methyl ester carboxylesterase